MAYMPLAVSMNTAVAVANRYLTQEEADAFASLSGKDISRRSTGLNVGFLIGLSLVRLPAEVMPPKNGTHTISSYARVLLGNMYGHKRAVAHSLSRGAISVLACMVASSLVTELGSSFYNFYEMNSDPRLAEYRASLLNLDPTERMKRTSQSRKNTEDHMRRESRHMIAQRNGTASRELMDDGAGDSGFYSQENDSKAYDSGSPSYSGVQDSTAKKVSQVQQTRTQQRPPQNVPSNTSYSEDTSTGNDFFDDASPAASQSNSRGNASSGGSAWARIRQGASASASNTQGTGSTPDQQQYQSQYDSLPSSSTGASSYGSRSDSDR